VRFLDGKSFKYVTLAEAVSLSSFIASVPIDETKASRTIVLVVVQREAEAKEPPYSRMGQLNVCL